MLKKIVIAVVVIAAIGAVGVFIADRTIFAPSQVTTGVPVAPTLAAPTTAPKPTPATAAPQVTTAPQQATAVPAVATGSAKLYRIDAAQSEAGYEVGETFFQDNRFATAIARTSGIAGDVLVDFANPANSQVGILVIDISQLKSDENRRDNFIRNNGLESSKYPQATFKPTKIEGLPASAKPGDQLTLKITGNLTVKETTKPVTFNVTLQTDGDQLTGAATTEILMSEFGVGPVKLAFLETEDKMKLFINFVALPAE